MIHELNFISTSTNHNFALQKLSLKSHLQFNHEVASPLSQANKKTETN